jgi:hypothetical protein
MRVLLGLTGVVACYYGIFLVFWFAVWQELKRRQKREGRGEAAGQKGSAAP